MVTVNKKEAAWWNELEDNLGCIEDGSISVGNPYYGLDGYLFVPYAHIVSFHGTSEAEESQFEASTGRTDGVAIAKDLRRINEIGCMGNLWVIKFSTNGGDGIVFVKLQVAMERRKGTIISCSPYGIGQCVEETKESTTSG
nr:hypothetical protein Iba_chr14aCG19730 [Ipomoea batatas]